MPSAPLGCRRYPRQLEEAITPKTKALILCSPSNPTGSVYTQEELKALADVLEKHPQVYIIADEIYEHINYIGQHESIAQFTTIHDRVVIVNGVSKGYAMTGWRIGWIAAPQWIASACNMLHAEAIHCGAAIHPMRHPVIAYPLDTPFTTTTRSCIVGNWAIDSCCPI